MLASNNIIPLLLIVFLSSCGIINPYFRLSALEKKGKYDLAHFRIDKLRSDSTHMLEMAYAKQMHFKNSKSPFFNTDSAYKYALTGKNYWQNGAERKKSYIRKQSQSESPFEKFILEIDSIAFEEAKSINSVKGYQHYIDLHKNSRFNAEAISIRNKLAFEAAKKENTYLAYKEFLEKYPNSDEAADAREIYELLLFETHTRDHHRSSYESFIDKFPHSPYRNEAIEELYYLITIDHREKSFQYFIDKYPESEKSDEARLWLKHMNSDSSDYSTWFVVPDENEDQLRIFSDTEENIIFEFDSLKDGYNCNNLLNPFKIYYKNGKQGLVSSNGRGLIPSIFEDLKFLNNQLILSESHNKKGVIHVSGFVILDASYDSISILNSKFLKLKHDQLWYFAASNGKLIQDRGFDDIRILNDSVIVFFNDDKKAIAHQSIFFNWPDFTLPKFKYDEVKSFDDLGLVLRKGDSMIICNNNLEILFADYCQSVEYENQYIIFHRENEISLYNHNFEKILEWNSDSLIITEFGYLVQSYPKWKCHFSGQMELEIDSLKVFKPYYVKFWIGDSVYIQTKNFHKNITDFKSLQVVFDKVNLSIHYFLYQKENGFGILDSNGHPIIKPEYEDIQYYTNGKFRIRKNSKYGLINDKGEVLLETKYDAISNFYDYGLTLLNQGKFGYYDLKRNLTIDAKFNRSINYYRLKKPLIAIQENEFLKLQFAFNSDNILLCEEIKLINDSTFFIRKDFKWQLYSLDSNNSFRDLNLSCRKFKIWKDSANNSHIIYEDISGIGFYDIEKNIKIYPEYYKLYPIQNHFGQLAYFLAFKYFEELDLYLFQVLDRDENILYKCTKKAEFIEATSCSNLHKF